MAVTIKSLSKELGIPEARFCIVGSTLVCGAGNDVDVLCLCDTDSALIDAGFVTDLDEEIRYESNFASWRRNGVNLLVTPDRAYFLSEIAIAHCARIANLGFCDLATREGRVEFHSSVRRVVAEYLDETRNYISAKETVLFA